MTRVARVLALAVPLLLAIAAVAVLVLSGASGDSEPGGGRFVYGIVPESTPPPDELQALSRGGVNGYRWAFAWSGAEPTPGSYDWAGTDALISELAKNQIEPIPFVCCLPSYLHLGAQGSPIGDRRAERGWSRFLRAAVNRYGRRGSFWHQNPGLPADPIQRWQIGNEPNSSTFNPPRPSPSRYAKLLSISHDAIKGVDPDAEIVLAGMAASPDPHSGTGVPARRFLDELYARGAEQDFDEVGVHPYAPTVDRVVGIVDSMRQTMDRHDDAGTPILVTEIGWGSATNTGSNLAVGIRKQAEDLREAFTRLSDERDRLNLDGLMWFTWKDRPNPAFCKWCDSAGLMNADGSPKPAWHAFESVAKR
jgi:polysaccharide biosynthesis protein PslG